MPPINKQQTEPITLLHKDPALAKSDKEELPPGKLRMVVTYLQMTKSRTDSVRQTRLEKLSIIRSYKPNTGFYRYLYNAVGDSWMWYVRKNISNEDLEKIINNPKVRIYVLYVDGTPAGYCELDFRVQNEVEIAYFGLIPEFIGRGLGLYFLEWAVRTAWAENPKRVWVHTCNYDHSKAVVTYQKAGFSAYSQETTIIDDPRI